ncbi:MAG: bifunctional heptose 7-phosphate kinase/heptose 1-phosphate adenyltransferase [Oscillospiraceae bacterium]|jgi:D-beta-D-heptose 7-phosphate kinase/D-beta-D-heptose 1-phosphate adenosyltransferase|nr:bifunctional heptose 7-phosphate kinase/heptose 1-phosphate adenyltransferase [Oscillospiraceae bacterium]
MKYIINNILSSNKKVLVIGDIMLDKYVSGDINRLSPEAPIPILSNTQIHYKLGGASNVCMNIHSVGIKVDLMGCVGNDENGNKVIEILKDNNISSKYVFRDNQMLTTVKTRYLSNTGNQLLRLDKERYYEYPDVSELVQKFNEIVEIYDLIVLSDYAKGFLSKSFLKEIFTLTNRYNKRTIIDPKSNDIRKYDGCYLIKPNKEEFERFYKSTKTSIEYIINNSENILTELDVERLLITCSDQGMIYLRRGENPFYQPSYCRQVTDVTGAGDIVTAMLAVGFICDLCDEESIMLANKCAGVSVEQRGTSVMDVDDLKKVLPVSNKLVKNKDILPLLRAHYQSKKIVFTNGCFDLLHIGHLDLLKQARQLGDVLILGLNSDASIHALKGERRPICNEKDRTTFLTLISEVDWIILFNNEEELLMIIEALCPDILVKGEEYRGKQITGKEFLDSVGGEIVLIPHKYNTSSTNIIKTIKSRMSLHE